MPDPAISIGSVLPEELPATLEGQTALFAQLAPNPDSRVSGWLGKLALLYGVPFENLVADPRMLPPESIRFFYLDVNWIESAVDGALSTGVHSDRDIRFDRVLRNRTGEITRNAANVVRSEARGEGAPAAATDQVAAGFLMRSAVVSGWPGLEVAGFTGADELSRKLRLMRMERLSPDVLLVIFDDVPALVVINEPKETLHFGVSSIRISTRNLQTLATQPGGIGDLLFRSSRPTNGALPASGVLNIRDLRDSIQRAIQRTLPPSPPPPPPPPLGSANFAIEMVDSAGKLLFTLAPEAPQP